MLGVGSVLADFSVGVKKGDWAEYHVEYTGTPPEGITLFGRGLKLRMFKEKS